MLSMRDHIQVVAFMSKSRCLQALLLVLITSVCFPAIAQERSLWVRASAYNSIPSQTEGNPNIGAWGDRLTPGMKAIAVSPDLIEDHGIKRGTKIRIDGLDGEFTVLDRMPDTWDEKIDIYMGTDVAKALNWGVRKVRIRW